MELQTATVVSPGSRPGTVHPDQVIANARTGLLAVADVVSPPSDDARAATRIVLEGVRAHVDMNEDILKRFRQAPSAELRSRILAILQEGFTRSATELFAYARRRGDLRVTLDVVLVVGSEAFVAHVGDGRVYLVRRGLVHQLTVDHVHGDEPLLADLGEEPGPATHVPADRSSVRVLGPNPAVRVESMCMELAEHDRFVLVAQPACRAIPDGVLHHHLVSEHLDRVGAALGRVAPEPPLLAVAAQLGGGEPEVLDGGRSRLAVLAPMALFAHCTERELRIVASATTPRRFAAGTTLFEEGAPGTELYLVISGSIDILHDATVVAQLGAGSTLGEMAMLDAPRRSATAVAHDDTEVMIISRESFFALLKGNPMLAVKILWNMLLRLSAHLRTTTEALAEARAGADQDGPVLTGPLLSEPGRRVDTFPHRSAAPAPLRTEAPAPPREVAERGDVDLLGDDDASLVGDEESSFHGEFVLGDEEPS